MVGFIFKELSIAHTVHIKETRTVLIYHFRNKCLKEFPLAWTQLDTDEILRQFVSLSQNALLKSRYKVI